MKRYLGGLPFRIDIRPLGGHITGPSVVLLHGNHVLNTVYVHAARPDDFLEKIGQGVNARAGDVVCFGHTHVPWHRTVDGIHYVNAGSVGRPKDADWRAAYVVLDLTAGGVHVDVLRVAYDVERSARAIVESGLPSDLADYLRTGGRPLAAQSPGGAASG